MAAKLSYGIKDAVAATGLSRQTLYRLIGRGEIATFKIGARTLILESVLRGFLQGRAAA